MTAQERVIEWGQPGRGALGSAVMLSLGPDETGTLWKIELAIDADPLPTRVKFSPDGGAVVNADLAETETPGGFIAYATFTAPLVRSARVELFSASGQRMDALCFQASLETGVTAKLAADGDRASLPPPPSMAPQNPASTVQAPASRVYMHPLKARLYGEAAPPPLPPLEGPVSRVEPPVSRVVAPPHAPEPRFEPPTEAGTAPAAPPPSPVVTVAGTAGDPPGGFGGPPGGPVNAESRSMRSLRSLLDNKDPAPPPGGPATPPPGQSAPWSFGGPPGGEPAAPPSSSMAARMAKAESGSSSLSNRLASPSSRVAAPGHAPVAAPPAAAPAAAAAPNSGFDAPSRKRKSSAKQGRNEWPRSLGEPGPHLGPKSPIDGAPILTFVEATREGTSMALEFALDDQGLVSSMVIARNGLELASVVPRRLTAVSPARVRVSVPDASPPLVLIARNAYNEAYPELVAGLDLGDKQFKPFQPNQDMWSKILQLGEPIDMDRTQCVACRTEIKISENAPWTRFAQEDREELRAQYPLTPDARALCRKCHEELILANRLLYRLAQAFSSRGLFALITRLVFCYIGVFSILTEPVSRLARVLSATFSGPQQDWLSFDLAAGLVACAIGSMPWPSWVDAFTDGWRRYLKGKRATSSAPFLVPLAIGGAIYFGMQHKATMPPWYMQNFFTVHLNGTAWVATIVATVINVLFQRVVDREAFERLIPHRRVIQLGKAGRLLPELFRVGTRAEYEREMDRLLIDGLGALEFQVFARERGEGKLSLTRSVGRFRSQLAHLHFDAGDPHVLGQVAKLGFPIAADDVGAGQLVEPDKLQMKIPFVVCIPVWSTGKVMEVYCVSRVRSTAVAEDVKGLADVIALSAGRSLHLLLTEA